MPCVIQTSQTINPPPPPHPTPTLTVLLSQQYHSLSHRGLRKYKTVSKLDIPRSWPFLLQTTASSLGDRGTILCAKHNTKRCEIEKRYTQQLHYLWPVWLNKTNLQPASLMSILTLTSRISIDYSMIFKHFQAMSCQLLVPGDIH